MICACQQPLQQLPTRMAPLQANLQAVAAISAKLAQSTQARLSAAARAAASAHVALGANLKAVIKAAAMANFVANMKSAFRIDLTSSQAGPLLQQLYQALQANNFAGAIGSVPPAAMNQLTQLANLANAIAGTGVGTMASALAGTPVGAQLAAAVSGGAANSVAALLNAQTAFQAGFGLQMGWQASAHGSVSASASMSGAVSGSANVAATAALNALAPKMSTLQNNLTQMPNFANVVSTAALTKALKTLQAISAVKQNLKVDLLQPGAGAALNKALAALPTTPGQAGGAAAGGGAAGAAAGGGAAGAAAGGMGNMAVTAQQVQNLTQSSRWQQTLGNLPSVPTAANLLATVVNQLQTTLGMDVVQHHPCSKSCLFFPTVPPGCLCPKMAENVP